MTYNIFLDFADPRESVITENVEISCQHLPLQAEHCSLSTNQNQMQNVSMKWTRRDSKMQVSSIKAAHI